MAEQIPHIDLAEFQQAGFLQEANRLFFHPLGLALEMKFLDETGDPDVKKAVYDALKDDCRLGVLIQNDAGGKLPNDEVLARIQLIADRVADRIAPPGSCRISGVWDYREDPEGMYFAQAVSRERAEAVERLRREHWDARCDLFGVSQAARRLIVDPDVQPVNWEPPVEAE